MQFVFMKNTGQTLFIRNDAMTAQWTQEELSVSADFPYLPDKEILQGYWMAFQWENEWQVFEVRSAKTLEPNHFQQITAESLVVGELTDEHIDEAEWDNISAETALRQALTGTLWQVGNVGASPVSSADITRGSVWQAVNNIKENWNVYIEPRYTLNANGSVGRYLDILPTGGTFNGLRLSVDKNLTDTSVTWDDSSTITAIKGYGTTINEQEGDETKSHVLTFADAVWQKTSTHPAKPLGDVWLIDPEATAAYGRNGRPRRGFYQNTAIDDPNVLLQKSWEELKKSRTPDLQIEGTVTDLRRLGYSDEPIKLHDKAIVEIRPTGFLVEKEIIRLTVDLLNPANTMPVIGDYIPNIIYINRKTNESATGSKGGGGGGRGQTVKEDEWYTNINANKYEIQLEAGQRKEGETVLHSEISIQANRITTEVTDRRQADNALSGRIDVEAGRIGLVVSGYGKDAKIRPAEIVMSINQQTGSYIKISANTINLSGYVTASQLAAVEADIRNLTTGLTTATTLKAAYLYAGTSFYLGGLVQVAQNVTIDGVRYALIGRRL